MQRLKEKRDGAVEKVNEIKVSNKTLENESANKRLTPSASL